MSSGKKYDMVIAGAGIVGLATAYKILEKIPNCRLCIVEKEPVVAAHQTGNNSGVIHSGIYYKPGSLKAINCRKGRNMLLDFCNENNILYEICGKVIVATSPEEFPSLYNLYNRGIENGLEGLKLLSGEEIKEYEPHAEGLKGLYVPQTGIIDYKIVCEKLADLIQEKGGTIFFENRIMNIRSESDGIEILTNREVFETKNLITCCGLQSDRIAKMTNPELDIKILPFRGEYYTIKKEKRDLVKNLIYPVPDPLFPFLGVHFTRMIDGKVEAGPNAVFAFAREGYNKFDFDVKDLADSIFWKGFFRIATKYWKTGLGEFYRSYSKPAFTKALQRMLPDIRESDLEPGGAGIRAQACDSKGVLIDDFLFIKNNNILHIINAPSPAATSCLSIGETITKMFFG